MERIEFWSGSEQGRKLSNFYQSPFYLKLKLGTFKFTSAEAAYQCLKSNNVTAERIHRFQQLSPKMAKLLGGKTEIRVDWLRVREDAMRFVLEAKFKNTLLRNYLISTDPKELVHAAPWDNFWGYGSSGKGKNRLGVILMEMRAELITAS